MCSTLQNILGEVFIYHITNGRYIECLSLTYATNKSKTYKKKEKELNLKKQKK